MIKILTVCLLWTFALSAENTYFSFDPQIFVTADHINNNDPQVTGKISELNKRKNCQFGTGIGFSNYFHKNDINYALYLGWNKFSFPTPSHASIEFGYSYFIYKNYSIGLFTGLGITFFDPSGEFNMGSILFGIQASVDNFLIKLSYDNSKGREYQYDENNATFFQSYEQIKVSVGYSIHKTMKMF